MILALWKSRTRSSRSVGLGLFKFGARRGRVGVAFRERGEVVIVLLEGLGGDGRGMPWLRWLGRRMEKSQRHVASLTSWWS
jgi:hypothetical protein